MAGIMLLGYTGEQEAFTERKGHSRRRMERGGIQESGAAGRKADQEVECWEAINTRHY